MARIRRHKHHSRKSRSNWALMGAFVASAAFAPPARVTRACHGARTPARDAAHRGAGRDAVCAALCAAQAPRGDERQMRFDIPAGPLRAVLAEIERISGVSIVVTNPAIAEISSPGVSGLFTPLEAIARAVEGTSVTSRPTGPNSVSLEIRLASEAVDVTGAIPQPRPSSPKYSQPLIEVPQTIEVIPARGDGSAGCDDLSDALEECSGHQSAGRRRRRRVEHLGRHVQSARIQRQQQSLCRRRP